MNEKYPIDEYGEGNCCPVCGSTRIDVRYIHYLEVFRDLKTHKVRFYNGKGEHVQNPSNKFIAGKYWDAISGEMEKSRMYICRKCGWKSDVINID